MKSIREGADGKQKALQQLIEGKDESGNGLSDREIEDSALSLFIAGYDTSATAAMAALYELHQDKEVLLTGKSLFQMSDSFYVPCS